jgi:DNA-binding NarL/FixJ family response regulator
MPSQRKIVLVNDSRLLRGILKRAIQRDHGLQVVAEVDDLAKFSSVIRQADVDWIILALPPGKPIPTIVDQALREQPKLNLLVMATDGSRVRMRWIEAHETDLDEKNLQELLAILREKGGKVVGEKFIERIDKEWI